MRAPRCCRKGRHCVGQPRPERAGNDPAQAAARRRRIGPCVCRTTDPHRRYGYGRGGMHSIAITNRCHPPTWASASMRVSRWSDASDAVGVITALLRAQEIRRQQTLVGAGPRLSHRAGVRVSYPFRLKPQKRRLFRDRPAGSPKLRRTPRKWLKSASAPTVLLSPTLNIFCA